MAHLRLLQTLAHTVAEMTVRVETGRNRAKITGCGCVRQLGTLSDRHVGLGGV